MKYQKLSILHIIPDLGVGGAEILVRDLVLNTDHSKFNVVVCSLYGPKDTFIENDIISSGIDLHFLDKQKGPDISVVKKLFCLINSIKPDVVHTHRYVLRYSLIPCLLNRIPLQVHTVHNIANKEVTFLGSMINAISYKFFNVVPVAISQNIQRSIIDYYKIKDVPVVLNGIDTKKIFSSLISKEIARGELNCGAHDFIIINIGRVDEQKNHLLLINAFSIVLRKHINAKLFIVGEGPLLSSLNEYISKKKLDTSVFLLGMRSDVPKLLSAADCFVLSSDWEGVPLVILESMAAKIPIVATNVGGLSDMIFDGVSGFLVPPGDHIKLSEKIIEYIDNTDLMNSFSKNASDYVVEKFDIKQTVLKYHELYIDKSI